MELGDLTQHNIKQLRLLNQTIFPVTYNDKVSCSVPRGRGIGAHARHR